MTSLLAEISTPILQLGCALLVGFLAFRCEWVTEKQGLAFLTGRIGLPMLAFKAVTTADLDDVQFLAVLSCFIGKLFVYLLACAASWIAYRKGSRSDALISMAIFSFHVTAANDFVFGIPIMQAFYPETGMTNLVANVVIQNVVFQVCSLAVLGIGTATAQNVIADENPERQSVRTLKQLAQDPLLCAIVAAVAYSGLVNLFAPHLRGSQRLPWIVGELLDFFTRPFSVTALLLTGVNLATALETKSLHSSDSNSMYFVTIPICLVVAKNFLCPYISLAAAEVLLPGSENNRWHSFAFLYGLIPTSSAPMLVAMRVGQHIEVVAAAVSIGILVAFPMLIASAVLLGSDSMDEGRIDQQLHNSDLTALGLSFASLMICIPCFRLRDRQSIWRKFPFRMLVWYVGACMFHALSGVLVNTLLPVCSRVGAYLISYCEIQRYVLVALMLHWLHRFEDGVRADKTIWIALVAPIPICACTPQPLTKKYCVLQGGEANRFYVLVGIVSFLILACLTLAGLLRSKRAEAESPRTPERSPQPALSFQVANSLVEFEPDSPTCYQHLGSSRSPTRLPIRASRQMTPPLSRRTLELEEIENASSEFASAINGTLLEDRFSDSGASQLTALANLKFAILVIASKCTVVLAISLVVRSILFFQPFHTETESALVFGLMVELLLENTEGIFVLLITLALFETQWSRLTRLLRMRHRQARSLVHSTERFPEELREGDGSMHLQ